MSNDGWSTQIGRPHPNGVDRRHWRSLGTPRIRSSNATRNARRSMSPGSRTSTAPTWPAAGVVADANSIKSMALARSIRNDPKSHLPDSQQLARHYDLDVVAQRRTVANESHWVGWRLQSFESRMELSLAVSMVLLVRRGQRDLVMERYEAPRSEPVRSNCPGYENWRL